MSAPSVGVEEEFLLVDPGPANPFPAMPRWPATRPNAVSISSSS